jgi:alanine racemase
MDYCMVRLPASGAIGEEVVLVGSQEGERISAEDVALRWGTINYEVVTGIAARVPRVYVGADPPTSQGGSPP